MWIRCEDGFLLNVDTGASIGLRVGGERPTDLVWMSDAENQICVIKANATEQDVVSVSVALDARTVV